jgi:hypothetical protein
MLLSWYMSEHDLTDAAAAQKFGISEKHVTKLRVRERKPSLRLAWRIFKASGGQIGLADWFAEDPPSLKALPIGKRVMAVRR